MADKRETKTDPSVPPLMRFRTLVTTCTNIGVFAASFWLAFLIRFDFEIPPYYRNHALHTLPAAVVIHYASFHFFHLTRGWWRYVGIADFANAIKAVILAGLAFASYIILTARRDYPRSIFLLNAILVVGLSIGMRLVVRLWRQMPSDRSGARRRLLIVGAGDTGEALLREIRQSSRLDYQVVAFIDDDLNKRSAYINGVPVVDDVAGLKEAVIRLQVGEIIVATPSASGTQMRNIIEQCRAAAVPFKVMPATWEVLHGRAGLNALREVDINDLLRRPPVALDLVGIGRFLTGKRVLVSGAAGSIGSEICRQVLRFQPQSLVCVDHDENALFFLEKSLAPLVENVKVSYRLADITDGVTMDALFTASRPQVVYHAAAHKHVPMLEANPSEGMRNNVFGTETFAEAAGRHQAEAFVLISTDKAVNPSSMMGASKRISELLIQTLPHKTRYTAVRFGNVLGSQGSVVPILQAQIAKGGPVTVTHPDMTRYFMTIPEAVELVIQASALGGGDEVFMLDMGDPVKIVDLASDLITLSGLRPGIDIEVQFTGIRPGEKLAEELHLEAEAARPTAHAKIMVCKHADLEASGFRILLQELREAVMRNDERGVRRIVPRLVPEYQPQQPVGAAVVPITEARKSSSLV